MTTASTCSSVRSMRTRRAGNGVRFSKSMALLRLEGLGDFQGPPLVLPRQRPLARARGNPSWQRLLALAVQQDLLSEQLDVVVRAHSNIARSGDHFDFAALGMNPFRRVMDDLAGANRDDIPG